MPKPLAEALGSLEEASLLDSANRYRTDPVTFLLSCEDLITSTGLDVIPQQIRELQGADQKIGSGWMLATLADQVEKFPALKQWFSDMLTRPAENRRGISEITTLMKDEQDLIATAMTPLRADAPDVLASIELMRRIYGSYFARGAYLTLEVLRRLET